MASEALAVINKEIEARGIPAPTWNTMMQTLYQGASPSSVLLVWDYCMARNLDPLKKPVHIVPMRVKQGDQWVERDTVLPGIYEYRTTAHRTGEYLGHDKPRYGPEIDAFGVKAPEWCEFTVHRWNEKAKMKVPYTVEIKFVESCGTKKEYIDNKATGKLVVNGRWERAPIQMLTKCAEAAALREAFPEEIGGVPTMEEIENQMPDVIDVTVTSEPIPTSWGRISDALRDRLEKAFAQLKMSAAQRLAKINEMVPNDATADEGAKRLLGWCQEEWAAQQGKTLKRKDSNNKVQTQAPPTTTAPTVAEGTSTVTQAVGEQSVERPSGAEGSKAGGAAPPPVVNAETVKAGDIPFASNAKTNGPRKAEEFF